MQAEKCIADDEEEKVGLIAEEVSKKQKGWIAVFIQYLHIPSVYGLYFWYKVFACIWCLLFL